MTIEKDPEQEPELSGSTEANVYSLTGRIRENVFSAGLTAFKRGDIEEAKKLFLRSAQMGNAGAYFALGVIEKEEDDIGEAKKQFKTAMGMGIRYACTQLGVIAKEEGDIQEVKRLARKALEMGDAGGAKILDPSLFADESEFI